MRKLGQLTYAGRTSHAFTTDDEYLTGHLHYRPDVDGLRAVAVLSVILFHAGIPGFAGGFVGVDIFFVISGFLITRLIVSDFERGTFSFPRFFERRARRILPALLVVLATSVTLAWLYLGATDFQSFSRSVLATLSFSSNIHFWRDTGYFDASVAQKPLLHTWSLAVEEQYYLLFPVLLVALLKRQRPWLGVALGLLMVASFSLAVGAFPRWPAATFFLLPTRLWEMLLGALIVFRPGLSVIKSTHIPYREAAALLGLVAVIVSIFCFDSNTAHPSIATVLPTLGAALVIAFAHPTEATFKVLSGRLWVRIGLISYSAYLWHQPLFAFARHAHYAELNLLQKCGLIALTLLLSFLTWRWVESPCRNTQLFSRRQLVSTSLFSAAALAILSGYGVASRGNPERPVAHRLAAMEPLPRQSPQTPFCREIQSSQALNICARTGEGKPRMILFGDSHAEDKFQGIGRVDPDAAWAVIGQTSCPPLFGVVIKGPQSQCQDRMEKAVNWIASEPDIQTVVLAFFGSYSLDTDWSADHQQNAYGPSRFSFHLARAPGSTKLFAFQEGLRQTVERLDRAGKKIVVLIDIPELPFFPVDCLKGRPDCAIAWVDAERRLAPHRAALSAIADEFASVRIFNPLPLFCNNSVCGIRSELGGVLYRDSHHLSTEGSQRYAEYFLPWLKKSP